MLAMTGDLIRKNTGFPGQEQLKQRPHPEKHRKSRTGAAKTKASSGKTAQIPDRKAFQRGLIRKNAGNPG